VKTPFCKFQTFVGSSLTNLEKNLNPPVAKQFMHL
jgi:hypothetical protein